MVCACYKCLDRSNAKFKRSSVFLGRKLFTSEPVDGQFVCPIRMSCGTLSVPSGNTKSHSAGLKRQSQAAVYMRAPGKARKIDLLKKSASVSELTTVTRPKPIAHSITEGNIVGYECSRLSEHKPSHPKLIMSDIHTDVSNTCDECLSDSADVENLGDWYDCDDELDDNLPEDEAGAFCGSGWGKPLFVVQRSTESYVQSLQRTLRACNHPGR